ncbi:hypothetical protein SYNPS1DRAFT_24595 [Syncephalis pseudoplumigaleata]|uniref:Uncharacterized protein n=1 Tax=Syncephalis pseudoplumigaleata TaxID=1712513 RepID=A0A4P9YTU1_9FUNG|nr:hypothetical protein SYNPS1DRAFT_24595 [Syncephalis pseudoplumigaleata]|eukprot:RKP23356.1 hypothetical protein SYNPS1DRAFT_24595 [Syncephalis pseudoplumigaleata]
MLLYEEPHDPRDQCIIAVSGYVCGSEHTLRAVFLACFICAVVTMVAAGAVIAYRLGHGLMTSLYRRIDEYLMPMPVDVLLVGWFVEKLLRTIAYAILFGDWAGYRMPYEVIYLLASTFVRITVVQFTIGIISHIPPVFSQRVRSHVRYYGRHAPRSPATPPSPTTKTLEQHEKYLLYVPPIRALYWFNVIYTTLWVLFTLGSGVLVSMGSSVSTVRFNFVFNEILSIASFFNYIIILLVSAYYCYGFYRIIESHTLSSSRSTDSQEKEKKVASNFRKIFLAVLALPLINILGTILRSIFVHYPSITSQVRIADLLLHQIIVYCCIEWIIFAFIFRSSRNQVRSRGASRAFSSSPSNNFSHPGGNTSGSKLQAASGSMPAPSTTQATLTTFVGSEASRREYAAHSTNGATVSSAPASPA